jgi:4-hydroxy-tetrahydrodipicolinate synthase
MLRALGQPVGECRLPLPPAPPQLEQRAHEVWAALNRSAAHVDR